jgi:hypothetical protein
MSQTELLVLGIGVSEHKTDGVLRFEHFCRIFGLDYRILGDGKIWKGGDMAAGTGGGQKINEVIEAIENLDNKLILLCDTFDLFPLARPNEIVEKFNELCDKNYVLFSSEVFCWPNTKLSKKYPQINSKYRYLNSGSIMGYRDDIYKLIKNGSIKDNDDDQLFFTLKYLSGEKIVLDHKCQLFQAINGSKDDLIVHKNRLYNKYTSSYPVFIHGNGPAKLFLNYVENYIESEPFHDYSCTINTSYLLNNQPAVFFALYGDSSQWYSFKSLICNANEINYQNKKIFVYDKRDDSEGEKYAQQFGYAYKPNISTYVFDDFKNSGCSYYFLLEQRCTISKFDILHELIPYCKNYHRIISPMLKSERKSSYTNFWGALDSNGYYSRSDDYYELVGREKIGLWNVPYVTGAILFSCEIIENFEIMRPNRFSDIDMCLCFNLRRDTLFMYMANFNEYGYIEE